MRILFLGTPDFAVPALAQLAHEPDIEIAGVICQPDRPAGRAGELRQPAVKIAALNLGLEVWQPEKIKAEASLSWLRARRPDALVVVAYGQILPRGVFELPPLGAINAHASLLPCYRGAAPIQWAIARGETETGVTTMRIEAGLDTGPILLAEKLAIAPRETARELSPRLAALAARLLPPTLRGLAAGTITPQPQDPAQATFAPLLKREAGRIDWRRSAAQIYNCWRGFQPWPGIFALAHGQPLIIHQCAVAESSDAPAELPRSYARSQAGEGEAGPWNGEAKKAAPPPLAVPERLAPGEVVQFQGRVLAGCHSGSDLLEIMEVQLAGRRRMSALEFLRGQPPGLRLE